MKIEILLGVIGARGRPSNERCGSRPRAGCPRPAFLGRLDFDRRGSANLAVGDQEVFDDDLVLERYNNNKTPENGLPQSQQQRLAGTHSGNLDRPPNSWC
jgi:hypothetical protein